MIFTYVHRGALDGSVEFPEAARWKTSVGSAGEPFIFGFHPTELPAYLAERGFTLERDGSTAEAAAVFNAQFGRHEPGSALYRVAVARRGGPLDRERAAGSQV